MKMESSTLFAAEKRLLICEDVVNLSELKLHYRLEAVGDAVCSCFCISISSDEDHALVRAGSDPLRALAYYRRIVDGGVTPCTLKDIFSDMQYLDENQ